MTTDTNGVYGIRFHFRARSPSGIQRIVYVTASCYEVALEKALLLYSNKFIISNKKQKRMDLVTAIDRAKKASVETKKPFYVIYEEDGECSLNTAPLKGASHKFINGEEDKSYQPKESSKPIPKGKVAETTVAVVNKIISTASSKKQVKTKNSTAMTKVKKVNKKAAKKVSKPAKKAAPVKKVAKKEAVTHKPKPHWGKEVSISIKGMLAGMKKGFRYRDPQGKFQSKVYLESRANQDYVREGMYVSKAE